MIRWLIEIGIIIHQSSHLLKEAAAGVGQLKSTAQLVSLIKMSGLVNVASAEDVDADAETIGDLRDALKTGNETDFKVVQIRCQLPDFAVGSSRWVGRKSYKSCLA